MQLVPGFEVGLNEGGEALAPQFLQEALGRGLDLRRGPEGDFFSGLLGELGNGFEEGAPGDDGGGGDDGVLFGFVALDDVAPLRGRAQVAEDEARIARELVEDGAAAAREAGEEFSGDCGVAPAEDLVDGAHLALELVVFGRG